MIKQYRKQPHTFAGFTLSLYLIIFGIMLLLVELSLMHARAWFYFLNFAWGKSLFSIFIALFLLGSARSVRWLDVLVAVWFIVLSLLFFVMFLAYRTSEQAHVQILIKNMEEKIAAKNKEAIEKSNPKQTQKVRGAK